MPTQLPQKAANPLLYFCRVYFMVGIWEKAFPHLQILMGSTLLQFL